MNQPYKHCEEAVTSTRTKSSRRAFTLAAVPLLLVAVVVVLLLRNGDGDVIAPPTPTAAAVGQPRQPPQAGRAARPLATIPPADPSAPAERQLLCDLDVDQVSRLLAPRDAADDPSASLRDAVPLLQERLAEWRSGAEGVQTAEDRLALVEDVLARWGEALTAYDLGDVGAAEEALAQSRQSLDKLDASLRDVPFPGC
jgi:hypothetical protein